MSTIVLTHADDVADADRYAQRFDADVWIHEGDREAAPFATDICAGRESFELAPEVLVIPTPGHTRGHVMVLLDGTVLFSGDSLVWDHARDDLWAEEAVCWHSWPEQLASLELLVGHHVEQVIPSHGAVSPVMPSAQFHRRLRDLLDRLRR